MRYSKQTWQNGVAGGTPLTAARLNHIEDGVDAAHAGLSPKGGSTIVLFGNSRVALESTAQGTQQRGMFAWANQMLRQRAGVVARSGLSGDTLTNMIARFPGDVAPYAPSLVLICDGINDIADDATLAQVQDRYGQLIELCRDIRARVILPTIAPSGFLTTGQKAVLGAANRWLKGLTDPFVLVVDVTAPVSAASGLAFAAEFATDGLHQSRRGAARMGRVLAEALNSILPTTDPLPSSAGDAGNVLTNPLMDGSLGAGTPTGWDVYPAHGAGVNYSVVARTDQAPGNWLQADTAGGGFPAYIASTGSLSGIAAAGDYVEAVIEVASNAGWTDVTGEVRLYCQALDAGGSALDATYDGMYVATAQHGDSGDATTYPVENQPGVNAPWVFRTPPLLVPPTATQGKIIFEYGGRGTIRLARAALRKV